MDVDSDLSEVLDIVASSQLDSQKTKILMQKIPSCCPQIQKCFEDNAHWNVRSQRFEGAPDWRLLARALSSIGHEDAEDRHMMLELNLDEELFDKFANRSTSGFVSFQEFQMMLAEADLQG